MKHKSWLDKYKRRGRGYRNGHAYPKTLKLYACDPVSTRNTLYSMEQAKTKSLDNSALTHIIKDKKTGVWSYKPTDKVNPDECSATIACYNKIKTLGVGSVSDDCSKYMSHTSLVGVQESSVDEEEIRSSFMQSVFRSHGPKGSINKYPGHLLDGRQIARGTSCIPQDFTINNVLYETHIKLAVPGCNMQILSDENSTQTTSSTNDSVFAAVKSIDELKSYLMGKTGKRVKKDNKFSVTGLPMFGTTIESGAMGTDYERKHFNEFSDEEKLEIVTRPLKVPLLQVHDASINCSNRSASEVLALMCEKCAEILNNKDLSVDLCLNEARMILSRISHSLVWEAANSLVVHLTNIWKSQDMTHEEQLDKIRREFLPFAERLMLTREKYGQVGTFAKREICGGPLLLQHPFTLMSRKYDNGSIELLEMNAARKEEKFIEAKNGGGQKHPKYRARQLVGKMGRTAGFKKLYYDGPQMFAKRIDKLYNKWGL